MTNHQFRKLALSIPGAIEKQHMGHPDFRTGPKGKIFATLQPDQKLAMVRMPLDQQALLVEREPGCFRLLGGWSKNGSTGIFLPRAKPSLIRDLLEQSFRLNSRR